METKELIAKIEANRAYYVTYANQCMYELAKKYKTEPYPSGGGAFIIHNINQATLEKICAKYGCSGFMAQDGKTGVVRNFGFYK